MSVPDATALFAEMERARGMGSGEGWDAQHEQSGSDDDNDDDEGTLPVVVRLPDGGVHVCRGFDCPYAVQSSEVDKAYTCVLSGRLIGTTMEAAHDSSWTGRSCGSADPDMNSGATQVSAWRNKRNAFAASAAAYSRASTMSIDDVVAFDEKPATDPKPIKRGAPCVVDVDEEALSEQKRSKALKRVAALQNRDVQTRLFADASSVVMKLFSVVSTGGKPTKKTDSAIAPATATVDDPRLENYNFVLKMALQRYVARCKHELRLPDLSGIHDVVAAANMFVKERQRTARGRTEALRTRQIVINGQVVEVCARLIFSLWVAMCSTTYFTQCQPGDSFRPFAAGVLYAMKRGVCWKQNLVLVPAIEALSSQLPQLRSTTATPSAKALQQASHKGLCSLHRGLASIDTMDADDRRTVEEQLGVCSRIAVRLESLVGGLTEE